MTTINFRANTPEYYQEQKLQQQNNSTNYATVNQNQNTQDSVEIANAQQAPVKEKSAIAEAIENTTGIDITNPKQALKVVGVSLAIVIGGMILGNKIAKPSYNFGSLIDDFLKSDKNIVGKGLKAINKVFSPALTSVKNFVTKPKFVQDTIQSIKNPKALRWNFFRGYGNGAKGIFAMTVADTLKQATGVVDINRAKNIIADNPKTIEIIKQALADNKISKKAAERALQNTAENLQNAQKTLTAITPKYERAVKALGKMVGDDKVDKLLADLVDPSVTNVNVADSFIDLLSKNNGGTPKELLKALNKFSEDADLDSLRNIEMDGWGFVNKLNRISKRLFKKESSMLKGDLIDSTMKYGAIRGKLAETAPAKVVQILPTLLAEQKTSFVNDKSNFGIMLVLTSVCPSVVKMLDPENDKKAKTEAHNLLKDSLSFLVSMPIAMAAVYGLAGLKGNSNKVLNGIGTVLSIGLDNHKKLPADAGRIAKFINATGGPRGIIGGIERFALVMWFKSKAEKPISKLCELLFGKPYDKSEQLKKQAQQQQMSQVIPELGISQKELMEKIQKNPQALEKIQNDPEAIKKLQQNPKLLLDVLDGKDINSLNASTSQSNPTMSPSLTSRLNNSGQNFATEKMDKKEQTQAPSASTTPTTSNYDTATYIPSSEYIAKSVEYDDATISKMNSVLAASDKVLEQFEKVRTL